MLAQHTCQFHGLPHVAIDRKFARHERSRWVQFAIKNGFECFGVGGQRHVCVVITGARAVGVDDDGAFAFDHKLCGAVKAGAVHFCVQGGDCLGYNVTHVFRPSWLMWRPASGVGRELRYITNMNMQTHRFKRIVTALFLAVGFSLPALAQETPLDDLYQDLLAADEDTYLRVEQQIIAEWEKSGSPAMDLLLRRGKDAMESGQPDLAVDHFSALVDHAPGFSEGYFGRATSYYFLDQVGPALADIQRVLQINPRHFEAMTVLAAMMEQLERPSDALALYEMILEISPQSIATQDAVKRLQLQLEGLAL